jgi:hypothetical protein
MLQKPLFKKLTVFLFLLLSVQAGAKTLYVSPVGNDKSLGTIKKPVATFSKAQELARTYSKTERTEVIFGNGIYYLPQTIVMTPVDNNITYRAENEGEAVLSGGNLLHLKWKPFKNGIFVANVKGNPTIDQLYVNGERQRMARYPNAVAGKNVFDAWELSHNAKADTATDPLNANRIATWSNPAGSYIHAMHNMLWGDMHWLIKGKKADGKLNMEGGWQNNRPSPMHPLYRMVENIFEELDAPGEWFYNAVEQKLYYLPTDNIDLKKAKIEIVRLKTLIDFKGSKAQPVQNIQLQGFVFRHAARTFMENKEQLLRSDWTVSRTAAASFNGATDCQITDCEFDQVGGNTILVNNYNQRITIKGCYIHDSGASGVVFVGDPNAVRSPLFRYGKQNYSTIDRTPGPKNDNYPADCVVDNCLITRTGRDEKQTAPVHISMAFGIKVSHCSIYDVPRAGININEGTFGGHVVEYCDVFNTVLETGDHGSFNSWGRDRYWTPSVKETSNEVAKDTTMPFWDMLAPNILRNTRWRCDHGWDIDLDDGSTNYLIYNNLLLNGGLKLREGYRRIATNNVIVNNSLHPHVWYENSGDVFRHNIVFNRYFPAIMNSAIPETGKWGKELDYNYFVASEAHKVKFNVNDCDLNSGFGEAKFVDAAKGDFRVQDNSEALKIGFVNFPMDQFGVQKPTLKAIAKTPVIPSLRLSYDKAAPITKVTKFIWMDVELKEPKGEEMSAFGIAFDAGGVALSTVNPDGIAAKLGFKTGDLLQEINGVKIKTIVDLNDYLGKNTSKANHKFKLIRNQTAQTLIVNSKLQLITKTEK